jgi:hypothetical protein
LILRCFFLGFRSESFSNAERPTGASFFSLVQTLPIHVQYSQSIRYVRNNNTQEPKGAMDSEALSRSIGSTVIPHQSRDVDNYRFGLLTRDIGNLNISVLGSEMLSLFCEKCQIDQNLSNQRVVTKLQKENPT